MNRGGAGISDKVGKWNGRGLSWSRDQQEEPKDGKKKPPVA